MKLTMAPIVARIAVCSTSSKWMVQRMQVRVPMKVPVTVPVSMGEYCCMIYELRVTNDELRMTNYELRITNDELRVANYE